MLRNGIILFAAALSGVAALFYEVLWIRALGESLGNSALAICWILTIFFVGQGVGGRIFGGFADRYQGSPRVFAAAEIILASCGLLFLTIRDACEAMGAPWAAGVFLVIPSVAMGGTVVALTRAAARDRGAAGAKFSLLYAVNTLGAAAGAFIVTFFAVPRIGVADAFASAAFCNMAAAAAAFFIKIPKIEAVQNSSYNPAEVAGRELYKYLLAAALSGFLAIALEQLFTRALAGRLPGTVYSFAIVLGIYLACLAVGSLIARVLAAAEFASARVVLFASAACAVFICIAGLQYSVAEVQRGSPAASLTRAEILYAFGMLAAPLLSAGLQLPILARLFAGGDGAGNKLGKLYIANAAGCVAAAWATPYLLFPTVGLKGTFLAAAICSISIAALFIQFKRWTDWIPSTLLVFAGGLAVDLFNTEIRPVYLSERKQQIIYYKEGPAASVAVLQHSGATSVLVNHQYSLGSSATDFAQKRQSLIPAILHGSPASALFLGAGTGSSAGALSHFTNMRRDVVEILSELKDTIPYFSYWNGGLETYLQKPGTTRFIFEDARRFVRETKDHYDLIVGDLFVPWHAGEGALYTKEHFDAVRSRLAPGGLFVQWLPLYQLNDGGLRVIVKTFLEAFPDASAWWLYYNAQLPAIGLAGSTGDFRLDPIRAARLLQNSDYKDTFSRAGLLDARVVLGSRICGPAELAEFCKQSPVETRDRPIIEFELGRDLEAMERRGTAPLVDRMLQISKPPANPAFVPAATEYYDTIRIYQHAVRRAMAGLQAVATKATRATAITEFEAAADLAPDWDFPRWNLSNLTKK